MRRRFIFELDHFVLRKSEQKIRRFFFEMDKSPSKKKVRGRWVISLGFLILTAIGVFFLRGSDAVYAVQPLLVGAIITPAQTYCGV